MTILVGKGIFHLVEVEKEPETGEVLNLESAMLQEGMWEVERKGTQKWGEGNYPYYERVARVGSIPKGTKSLPCTVLNC